MSRLLNKQSKGFTLIELMIVVAIIGILSAIAIPQFMNYQMKAKTSEAKTNIGSINTAETAYAAEHGVFKTCSQNPSSAPNSTKQAWSTGSNFEDIGFSPQGDVFYVYGVSSGSEPSDQSNLASDASDGEVTMGDNDIWMIATGDLDGDGTYYSFYSNNTNKNIKSTGTKW